MQATRDRYRTMLAPFVACLILLGVVPMIYMRGNNGSYDATYLAENCEIPRPYRRGRNAAGNYTADTTIFFPIVW